MASHQGWFEWAGPGYWVKEHDTIDGKVVAGLNGLRGPLFEVLLYAGAAFTGFWGSAHSADVLRGLGKFAWVTSPEFNLNATVFAVLFFVTSLFYALQRLALRVQREAQDQTQGNYQKQLKNAQDELVSKSDKLEHLVRTMPPTNFLEFTARRFVSSENDVATVLQVPENQRNPAMIENAIRVVLDNIAEVARMFDGGSLETYHANIMLYHPPFEIEADATFKKELEDRLLFQRHKSSIHDNQGVLDLQRDLSVVTTNDPGSGLERDRALRGVALAIPRELMVEIKGQDKYNTLPGAPIAWAQRKADSYANTEELLSWYKETCVRDDLVEQEIEKYFQEESFGIGSFASFALMFNEKEEDETILPSTSASPLLLQTAEGCQFYIDDMAEDALDGNDEVPIGVLNLHRKSPGILKGDEQAGPYFMSATRPFRILCTRLLYLLRAVQKQQQTKEEE